MIDIHSHIIHGVDDGPASVKDSIRMVLEAEKLGIKVIIATPHLHAGLFDIRNAECNLQDLIERTSDCGIELCPGYEVFLDSSLPDSIRDGKPLTLNKSRYLLLELPFDLLPVYSFDIIYRLHLENVIPVIAHPERDKYFIRDFSTFISLLEKGCLIQVDAASIIGVYGQEVKNFARKLIKLDMVNFVASDAHSVENYSEWYTAAYKKVAKWAGMERARKLFCKNPAMILKDSRD